VTVGRDDLLAQLQQPRLSELNLGDCRVRISSPDRVFWPATADEPAITRRDLLAYYVRIADYVLPHLKDRPLTLLRYPTGITGKHFFQKHVEFDPPPFVDRECLISEHTNTDGLYLFCNNLATLLWLVQVANLELHTWYSRTDNEPDAHGLPHTFGGSVEAFEASVLNYPDFMVFDLDPYLYSGRERRGGQPEMHEKGFRQTCEVARWFREVLEMRLGLKPFVKASGKTGLHIFVPILRQFDFDTVRAMSEQICRFVLNEHPNETTMEWSVERRRGKVFLDYNQNTRGKTLATPYSPRVLARAPVSVPLQWDELDRVYPTEFRLRTVERRLREVGDLWADILSHKADLAQLFSSFEPGSSRAPAPAAPRRGGLASARR
jgi:bifunctional non-homologous end joining protein LigD